jgi:hypothetical protein
MNAADDWPYQIVYVAAWAVLLSLQLACLVKIYHAIYRGEVIQQLLDCSFDFVNLILNIKHKHALGYSYLIYREKYDCAICLQEVVPLEMGGQCCNKHMYHTECIR